MPPVMNPSITMLLNMKIVNNTNSFHPCTEVPEREVQVNAAR